MRTAWPVILGAGVVFLLILAAVQSDRGLSRSALGLEGLRHWINADGLSVRDFRGGYPIRTEGIGLRIVPVYDSNLDRRAPVAPTAEERMRSGTEYDLAPDTLLEKAEAIPTLFVLPKWRAAARVSGGFHPDFLIPDRAVSRVADRLILDDATVTRSRTGFGDIPHDGRMARLYAPQTLAAAACTPIIGPQDAMVLARCFLTPRETGKPSVEAFVVADPDLLNTHGLRLGDNAWIARDVLEEIADGSDILIDRSTAVWTVSEARPVERERSWSDLARYFEGPFRLLWILFAIGTVFLFWRAWMRFGAVRNTDDNRPAASRAASVGAEVRLLRGTGDHPALARGYVDARLRRFAAGVFPGHTALREARMWAALNSAAPDAAGALQRSADRLRRLATNQDGAATLAAIEEFERDMMQVKNAIERSA